MRLKWEPCVTAAEIGVSAANGVVTLNGTVPTYAEKWAAERAAQRVEGVKAIAEEIQIKPIGMHAKTDAEIAAVAAVIPQIACLGADRHPGHRAERLGHVEGRGELGVPAEGGDRLRPLSGRREGRHERHHPQTDGPADAVKDAIEKALVRNAEIDAGNVKVAADGGTVTLVRQRPVVGREAPGRDGRLERPGSR